MNLLELANRDHSQVYKTDEMIKVPMLNHQSETLPVYKINVNQLYYNDKNARIASWVSNYKKKNDISEFDTSNRDKYNSIIEDFIVKSNEAALKKTQKNIKELGQQVAGVVLKDGRVIDGNRRFTCLRRIQKETGEPQMFSACIVEYDVEADAKAIKEMELMLQIGTEKPLDYDPIERLQDVYMTVVENRLLTEKEYADRCNITLSQMRKEVEKANILVKFLEFIEAPMDFYRARELKFDGPLNEIVTMVSNKSEGEKERLLNVAFANFIVQPEGDITRFIRNFKKIAKSDKLDGFLDDEDQYVEQVLEAFEDKKDTTVAIQELRADKHLASSLRNACDRYSLLAGREGVLDAILENSSKAVTALQSIDPDLFLRLSDEQIEMLDDNLIGAFNRAKELRERLDAIKS